MTLARKSLCLAVLVLAATASVAVAATLNGTNNPDVIIGTISSDTINARGGNDTVWGLGGVLDKIDAGAGDDTVHGDGMCPRGTHNKVGGASLDDYCSAGETGQDGIDAILGGTGDDTLFGGGGNDALAGGDGNDIINGGSKADAIAGGAGDDLISGGSGNDIVTGGTGGDFAFGNAGNDTFQIRDRAIDNVNAAMASTRSSPTRMPTRSTETASPSSTGSARPTLAAARPCRDVGRQGCARRGDRVTQVTRDVTERHARGPGCRRAVAPTHRRGSAVKAA